MSPFSRILTVAAVLCLLLLFYFPMWKIELHAPQYPEGLEMHIWINKIGGNTEFTIQNFNILNHYIGMAEIHEDSFKELKFMPPIVIALMILGIIAAVAGNKYLLAGWVGLLMIASIAGLADFYFWLKEFGTNLDPTAPIKVPGATYIPPLIGPKMLLNFKAVSYPALGGIGVTLAILIGIFNIYLNFFRYRIQSKKIKPITKKLEFA